MNAERALITPGNRTANPPLLLGAESLEYSYSPNRRVFSDVSLEIREGECVCLFGASGIGKTTLLRCLTGELASSSGKIDVYSAPALMDQSSRLLPWRTVLENVLLSAELREEDLQKTVPTAIALLDRAGLSENCHSFPDTLSGGMQQRTAFIRSLLEDRKILLLDEPFSAVDGHRRSIMCDMLRGHVRANRTGALVVTHLVEEAISIADKILVFSGTPASITDVLAIDLPESQRNPEGIRRWKHYPQLFSKLWQYIGGES